jgi:hypothetical protein
MKKIIKLFLLMLYASFANAQSNYTFIFNRGISLKKGFVEGGIQVTLPEEFTFYVYGDRQISNIEKFNSLEEFKSKEEEILKKNKKIFFQKKCGSDLECGDIEISYEVHNSEGLGYCRVIFFYYESFLSNNSVGDWWFSLADGEHTILIVTDDGVTFQKKIKLKNGLLAD